MYSESDIDSAVAAGALDPQAAAALREHTARMRAAPVSVPGEEHFRLLTGFNDVFVSIAGILMLAAVGWLGGPVYGSAAIAACAWGLAEYFTRVRRMALPSILLHLAFVGAIAVLMFRLPAFLGIESDEEGWRAAAAAATACAASWLHWRRFRVPITVAILLGSALAALVAMLLTVFPALRSASSAILLLAGLTVFAAAMAWDMSDPRRQTRSSDVAFWLHLLAAPLLVHPLFTAASLQEMGGPAGRAVLVLAVYALMAVVALAIDRRALMVSALVYVLVALNALLQEFGAVGTAMGIAALAIGSALLFLSALWTQARRAVVRWLPAAVLRRLPPVA